MRAFKRIGITLVVVLFLSIFLTGLQIYFDMIEREEDLNSYVRLAVKDAIVNIQTTEESGLNFLTSADKRRTTENYGAYLSTLSKEATSNETLKLLRKFLEENQTSTGDARFRPIQFGMTYVDTELFKESFVASIENLINANYSHDKSKQASTNGITFDTKSDNTLIIKTDASLASGVGPYGSLQERYGEPSNVDGYNIRLTIDGPHIVELKHVEGNITAEKIYESLYGSDKKKKYIDEINSSTNLGISSESMPDFFIYYDITVVVGWSSVTTNPLLRKGFLGDVWGVPDTYFNKNEYLMVPGRPIEYDYRYILLN